MNTVNLVGRIGNELELQMTRNGKPTVRINLAVRRNKETTDWFNLVAYNQTAQNITQYFQKGDLIGITGQLFAENWEKQDGTKVNTVKVLVQEYTFCNGNAKKEPFSVEESPKFDIGTQIDIESDDLPF